MALVQLEFAKSARATFTATDAAQISDMESRAAAAGWDTILDADTFGVAMIAPDLSGDLAVIFAAKDASVGTPTMRSPDTAQTGELLVGIYKGGALTGAETLNWDAADPLGAGGTFSGYYRGIDYASSTRLTMLFSGESLVVAHDNNATGTLKYIIAGAIIEPHATNATDTEVNGRVYGMIVSGGVATTGVSSAGWSSNTASSATGNGYLADGAADGNAHVGSWLPRSTTWRTHGKEVAMTLTSTSYITPGNVTLFRPMVLHISAGFDPGVTRGFGITKQISLNGLTEQHDFGSGAEDAMHYLCGGVVTIGDPIGFQAHAAQD